MHENQNINSTAQKKAIVINDIEKEILYTQEKMRQVQNEIDRTRQTEGNIHSDKADIDRVI